MFKKIRSFVAESWAGRQGMAELDYLDQQIECGERLRDMLSVARKLKMPVVVRVEVQGLTQGVIDAGGGNVAEFLYNFAAGRLLILYTKRSEAILSDVDEGEPERGGGVSGPGCV